MEVTPSGAARSGGHGVLRWSTARSRGARDSFWSGTVDPLYVAELNNFALRVEKDEPLFACSLYERALTVDPNHAAAHHN